MLNLLGLPVEASTHAAEIDQMIVLVHWLMLVLFVGWGGFFVFVLFRFRKSANPKADYTGAKGKFAKGTELAVVVVEMALLVHLCDSCVGRARQGVSGRRDPNVTLFTWWRSSSNGTSTIRGRTASLAGPTSSSCRPTTRSVSIGPTPSAKDDW